MLIEWPSSIDCMSNTNNMGEHTSHWDGSMERSDNIISPTPIWKFLNQNNYYKPLSQPCHHGAHQISTSFRLKQPLMYDYCCFSQKTSLCVLYDKDHIYPKNKQMQMEGENEKSTEEKWWHFHYHSLKQKLYSHAISPILFVI